MPSKFADGDGVRRFPKGCIDINMLDIRQSLDIFQSRPADDGNFSFWCVWHAVSSSRLIPNSLQTYSIGIVLATENVYISFSCLSLIFLLVIGFLIIPFSVIMAVMYLFGGDIKRRIRRADITRGDGDPF